MNNLSLNRYELLAVWTVFLFVAAFGRVDGAQISVGEHVIVHGQHGPLEPLLIPVTIASDGTEQIQWMKFSMGLYRHQTGQGTRQMSWMYQRGAPEADWPSLEANRLPLELYGSMWDTGRTPLDSANNLHLGGYVDTPRDADGWVNALLYSLSGPLDVPVIGLLITYAAQVASPSLGPMAPGLYTIDPNFNANHDYCLFENCNNQYYTHTGAGTNPNVEDVAFEFDVGRLVILDAGGDFNGDGSVNAADYIWWRKHAPDYAAGYGLWRGHFGNPEPPSLVYVGIAALFWPRRGRRK